ncbi:hypothetical protein DFP73DRAFT_570443 [Morchella snyderi]|nr:hypothetical protein DFP73DRAFT_570443 [Morchella snyderi]
MRYTLLLLPRHLKFGIRCSSQPGRGRYMWSAGCSVPCHMSTGARVILYDQSEFNPINPPIPITPPPRNNHRYNYNNYYTPPISLPLPLPLPSYIPPSPLRPQRPLAPTKLPHHHRHKRNLPRVQLQLKHARPQHPHAHLPAHGAKIHLLRYRPLPQ